MRIAQVSPLIESVPPAGYGGTERIVHYLTEELVRLGHEVTLFASGDSHTSARLEPCSPSALRQAGVTDYLGYHMAMLERVYRRAHEFDIIHFHVDHVHYPFSRRHSVAHVTTLHGRLDLPELDPVFDEYPEMPVVSISNAQRRPRPGLNWQATIYHGMPVDRFWPVASPGKYLAFLGRVSAEKGLHDAVAIAEAAGMELWVAAKIDPVIDQDYLDRIGRALLRRPCVRFLGEIGDDRKNEFLAGAYALLFPIDWEEPFGMVMMEAIACGTPVIAYARGSVPEVLDDGVTGFVVRDVDGALAALERVRDFDRRRCRQVFERRFSSWRMARDYLDCYQRLLRARLLPHSGGLKRAN